MLPDRREPCSDGLLPNTVRAVAGPELYRGTCIPVNAPVRKAELYDLVPFGSDGSVLLPAVSLAFFIGPWGNNLARCHGRRQADTGIAIYAFNFSL